MVVLFTVHNGWMWVVTNCDGSFANCTRLCFEELHGTVWGWCACFDLLYVHVIMTLVKCLSYSTTTDFAGNVLSSQCLRTIIRGLHDGIWSASYSRVAFLWQYPIEQHSYWTRDASISGYDGDDTSWSDTFTMALRRT